MKHLRSLCVFCGSRTGADAAYSRAAEHLGRLLAHHRVRLVYGGGSIGLMGVMMQSVLDHGGEVTGVIPEFLMHREVGNPSLTELVVVDSMHTRKQRMFELADAFAILPGGLGTLDETIEIITWKQLRLHGKPIAVLSIDDYWSSFEALIDRVIEQGFADAGIRDLYSVAADPESLLATLDARAAASSAESSRRL
ncbi:MAG: TIGR00730 family Rossman fold protein [Gammaproteobacteria bacterium]|nr:TIGR00730 family Rossman fold protein [Gammaproteobacteria bacterium]NIM72998.1 TIGR00730 family Rossman fold protein [Gammaproteobacteria bacterium]NIN38614.1 TIGR00730 family Rossman fold protein [Gammaproteobacteria bacterium]NIO24750.1 TIGR00730 family Rossman fold protein [Gammaproteobacteria bacterium]NIO65353.1 TIGR00730 family Rossman fold protein [Gammaproteobacteria bacterium]